MIVLIIILAWLLAAAALWIFILERQNKQVIEINHAAEIRNQQIAEENNELTSQIQDNRKLNLILTTQIDSSKQELQNLQELLETNKQSILITSKEQADKEFQQYKTSLEKEYSSIITDLLNQTNGIMEEYQHEEFKLSDIRAKQEAYIQAQLRAEEMQAQQDYYRLLLTPNDLNDIHLLRDMQQKLTRHEAIDKVIWEIYYKPSYNILTSHLFNATDKICGIYKITCLTNDKAYIGQSVDIKNRFKEHIRAALEFGNKTNKLYKLMSEEGPENFTFEILEEVPRAQLNEREIYWIDFYKTKEYGLNKTAGGA